MGHLTKGLFAFSTNESKTGLNATLCNSGAILKQNNKVFLSKVILSFSLVDFFNRFMGFIYAVKCPSAVCPKTPSLTITNYKM